MCRCLLFKLYLKVLCYILLYLSLMRLIGVEQYRPKLLMSFKKCLSWLNPAQGHKGGSIAIGQHSRRSYNCGTQ